MVILKVMMGTDRKKENEMMKNFLNLLTVLIWLSEIRFLRNIVKS